MLQTGYLVLNLRFRQTLYCQKKKTTEQVVNLDKLLQKYTSQKAWQILLHTIPLQHLAQRNLCRYKKMIQKTFYETWT